MGSQSRPDSALEENQEVEVVNSMPTPTHEIQPAVVEQKEDRYVVIGCNKGQVIVLDLGENDHETVYARYQIGAVDEQIEQIYDMPTQEIFVSFCNPEFVATFWTFGGQNEIKVLQ